MTRMMTWMRRTNGLGDRRTKWLLTRSLQGTLHHLILSLSLILRPLLNLTRILYHFLILVLSHLNSHLLTFFLNSLRAFLLLFLNLCLDHTFNDLIFLLATLSLRLLLLSHFMQDHRYSPHRRQPTTT